jgi:putative pyoverdin transport system ATP-binding/permease protein
MRQNTDANSRKQRVNLLSLLAARSPNGVFLSTMSGALAGVSYSLLIPIILAAAASASGEDSAAAGTVYEVLHVQIANQRFALLFVCICSFILLARTLSQILLARVALDATTDLRVDIYRRILNAPLIALERIGAAKLLAAITTDTQRIVMGASLMPAVLISSVTIAGLMGYLLFISSRIFLIVLGALAFGILTYQVPMIIGRVYFERARHQVDALYEAIRGLIGGSKELKLSREKQRRYLHDILLANEDVVRRTSKRGNTIITAAVSYGDLLSLLVIGGLTFVYTNYHSVSGDKLLAVILVLIYITGPVASVLNAIPQIVSATVSLRVLNGIFAQLAAEETGMPTRPLGDWRGVRLANVSFDYGSPQRSFVLGPIDLEIRRGEITFIVGGNGSGKSTLSKILSLHYTPNGGEIYFDAVRIDAHALRAAREQIAAIFPDYFLFDRLLDAHGRNDESAVTRYLADLGLDKMVTVLGGRFSTTSLSDGQKRRLALLVAVLDDRQMYIFDEWAADQDPEFKKVFYHEILPALKKSDKAVVVITHDDRYFHVADQVIVMEDGKLLRTETRRERVA